MPVHTRGFVLAAAAAKRTTLTKNNNSQAMLPRQDAAIVPATSNMKPVALFSSLSSPNEEAAVRNSSEDPTATETIPQKKRTRSTKAATAEVALVTPAFPETAPTISSRSSSSSSSLLATAATASDPSSPDGEEAATETTPKKKRTGKNTVSARTTAVLVTPPPAPASPRPSETEQSHTSSNEKKAAKPRRKSATAAATAEPFTPPDDWQDLWSLVRELRRDQTAPCDHSGCEALPDATVAPATFRFQVLLSLMLSSQTKDAVVGAAVRAMQRDNVATVAALVQMTPAALIPYINKVGFYNNKTIFILETVQILQDSYGGDIPKTADEMMTLPGVGPKMAYICESVAWGTQSGIGVDTHMHRLFPLLGFVPRHCKTPEQTRVVLQSWLPRDYWGEVNGLWVGFGQEVQQEKAKLLRKALLCSQPRAALVLLQRVGLTQQNMRANLDDADMARAEAFLQNVCTDDENEK
jgi:endonuclease III